MILLVTFAGIAHGFSLEKAAFYVFFLDGDFSGIYHVKTAIENGHRNSQFAHSRR